MIEFQLDGADDPFGPEAINEIMRKDCLVFALEFSREHLFYLKRLDPKEAYVDGFKKAGLV